MGSFRRFLPSNCIHPKHHLWARLWNAIESRAIVFDASSGDALKPIRRTAHAQGYLSSRGFTVAEVEEAIRTGMWLSAAHGRQETSKEFPDSQDWNGTFYATKRVRPIFVEEPTEIVFITVYTYFF